MSASASLLLSVVFGAGIVGYLGEPESSRAATCITDSTNAGPMGSGPQFAAFVGLVTAVSAFVLARKALAVEEGRAVPIISFVLAGIAVLAGLVLFAAFLISNNNACGPW